MKTKTGICRFSLLLILGVIAALSAFLFSGKEPHTADVGGGVYLAAGDKVTIMDNGKSDFADIIFDSSAYTGASGDGVALEDYFYKYSEDIYARKESSTTPTKNVITFGRIDNVPLSVRLADAVDACSATSYAWGIAYEDGVLALYANSKYAVNSPVSRTLSGHDIFKDLYSALDLLVFGGKVIVTEGQFEVFEVTAEEYAALIEADDRQYEAEEDERRALRVEFIKSEMEKMKAEDFGTEETGYTLTTDFGKAASGSPDYYPTAASHPRVLFTKDDIPAIRERLESLEGSSGIYRKLQQYIDDESFDGILGEPRKQGRGYHNYSVDALYSIQAHALYYALYGEEYYGYTAIYAMKNFLLTLYVDYIFSDQCREFGYAMYIAACVYDWCYDLLTDADKEQIAMGVEHRLCRGEVPNTMNGILSTSYPVKMEMGFPPKSQGAVGGHGSEFQLLRDYLAMSIAVYDELPGWYEFVGGRFYNEYVVVRRDYYGAGIYPQGMSYGPYRFLPDTYGAALIKAATGKSAYGDEIADVIYTFLSNETVNGGMFSTGDCGPTSLPGKSIGSEALILSFVLGGADSELLLQISEQMMSEKDFTETSLESVSVAEFFIFSSRASSENGEEYREYLPLIWYNGGYMGQYIARNTWDEEAAVVMMRVGVRTTGNHDHKDAGTFQIYYKGLISGSSGGSGTYGSAHWGYYYQATVSDNGLLIFDPSLASTTPNMKLDGNGNPVLDSFGNPTYNNASTLFYTGSQTRPGTDPQSYADWVSGKYERAKLLGFAEGYSQIGEPTYAYIASDITASYTPAQASYVGRSMLTVYTGDENYPMIFFVFDNIDAAKDELVKKFLLQINGESAPVIDGVSKTVTVEENDGQLVLQNVLGAEKIDGIGGGYGSNFVINGTNCVDNSIDATHPSQKSWGRVELSSTGEDSSDFMLNVIYVSDKGNKNLLSASSVKAYDCETGEKVLFEGASIGKVTALFSTEYDRTVDEFAFSADGEGLMTYYIGGLFEGTWRVSIDGVYAGSVYSTRSSGLVSFKANAGSEIKLTPGNDIRPAGSEKLTFITNGGAVKGDAPSYYFPGTELILPTDVVRGLDNFGGWYLDKELTRPITKIPEDAKGALVLYAKWQAVFAVEDYSSANIDLSDRTSGSASSKGISYLVTDNKLTTYKTEETADGRKYLYWKTAGEGPTVFMDATGTSIATMDSEQITYVFEFADAGEEKDLNVAVRVRNAATPKATVQLFNISGGKVMFYDTKIATLKEDSFTRITVVVDFALGEVRAMSSEGDKVYSTSVALPERLTFSRELFAMRASGEGSLRLGLVKLVEGDAMGAGSTPAPNDYIEFPQYTTLPDGYDVTYTPGEAKKLPTDGVSAVIDGVKHELVGWYLDEALTSPITELPEDAVGKFKVFAKWRRVLVSESYTEAQIDIIDKTSIFKSEGGITYLETGGKTTTFKTEDGYLLWRSDGAGSTVYMDATDLSIAGLTEEQISYVFELADAKEESDMNLDVRVRNTASPKETVDLFKVLGGKITFDGKEVAALAEDGFTTVTVVVDFFSNQIRLYVSGVDEEIVRITSLPERASFSREVFAIRAASAGAVKIGSIKALEGDIVNKTSQNPAQNNYIDFPKEANIPEGYDRTYAPNEKTPLPVGITGLIGETKVELVGWYLDEALTTPITAVPDGVSGRFTVYAKWRAMLAFEDYSETELNFTEITYKYPAAQIGGISYYETDGKAVTYRTEEENGERYLFWESAGAGPQILMEKNTDIADTSSKQITYVFEIADGGTDKDMSIGVRVRNDVKTEIPLFGVAAGKLRFNEQDVSELSEGEFSTVTVVIDFELGEVRAYFPGAVEPLVRRAELPAQSSFTRELFSMRANSDGAIKIGSIKVYDGDIFAS